jgi:hypothetical protein
MQGCDQSFDIRDGYRSLKCKKTMKICLMFNFEVENDYIVEDNQQETLLIKWTRILFDQELWKEW